MTNGNDGLRFVFDLRGGKFFWTFTDLGELFESHRGFNSLPLASVDAENFHPTAQAWSTFQTAAGSKAGGIGISDCRSLAR